MEVTDITIKNSKKAFQTIVSKFGVNDEKTITELYKMLRLAYDCGYNDGYNDGIDDVCEQTDEETYNDAYDEGYNNGYEDGMDDAYESLDEGFEDKPTHCKKECDEECYGCPCYCERCGKCTVNFEEEDNND